MSSQVLAYHLSKCLSILVFQRFKCVVICSHMYFFTLFSASEHMYLWNRRYTNVYNNNINNNNNNNNNKLHQKVLI